MDKLPMSSGDANMWYRNCTVQAHVDGETRAVVVSGFRPNLNLVGRAMVGWSDANEDIRWQEVVLEPKDYELTMPRSGYFVDAEGDLLYIELRALKTIRRAMMGERITTLQCYKGEGILRHKRQYLAMEAMMTGRVDQRILTPTLAISADNKLHYRGVHIGRLNKEGMTLKPAYQYLEGYVNHAINV